MQAFYNWQRGEIVARGCTLAGLAVATPLSISFFLQASIALAVASKDS